MKGVFSLLPCMLIMVVLFGTVSAQKTEITILLNEQFFDAALDAVFANGGPPEFSIAGREKNASEPSFGTVSYNGRTAGDCVETIRLLREGSGTRTSVRFRDGGVYAPLAFTGTYSAPFIGCVNFAGRAVTKVDLDLDGSRQVLTAKAHVENVALNGTGGIGSGLVAKLVQGSVDRKLNPIDLISLDKLSFPLPMKGSRPLAMKATSIRYEVRQGEIAMIISYEFVTS